MHHQRIVVVLIALAVGLSTMGCSSTHMSNEAEVLHPCPWAEDGDPRLNSMGALIRAFQDNKWKIVQGSAEHGFVRAEACRRATCISVDAYVAPSGGVEIYRSPRQDLSRNEGQLLVGWMHKLGRRYEDYRCDPPSHSAKLVKGLKMPAASIPPKP